MQLLYLYPISPALHNQLDPSLRLGSGIFLSRAVLLATSLAEPVDP